MERDALERFLADGLSLAEIGRRVGRHEATVAYWLKKHGLRPANRRKHAARGGIEREHLAALVQEGLSIAQIAERVDRSKATVRHWLRRHGLRTLNGVGRPPDAQARKARDAGLVVSEMTCRVHGPTSFVIDGRGYYRCRRCRADAVSRRRRKVKATLVLEAGGACRLCGYDEDMRALEFHHLRPAEKRFEINARGCALGIETLRAEARKCVLLCSNCHAEVESGTRTVSGLSASTVESRSPG